MKKADFLNETPVPYVDTEFDTLLTILCDLIVKGQELDPDQYGMVAAAVVDPKGRVVASTSISVNDNWCHAERSAIDQYTNKYGPIPKGCSIVTTLSPCSESMKDRYGGSCEDMIEDLGIEDVYCGYQDPTQASGYSITENQKIQKLCKEFADTFLKTHINESVRQTLVDFLPLAQKELGLKRLPTIRVVNQVPDAGGTTFGRYVPEEDVVYVVARGRHPKDTLRTLAHELVHHKQDIEDRLDITSGETGSPEENEANALAGVLMRKYNELNPIEVNENFADGRVKGKSRPGRVKRAGASCNGSVTDLRAKAKKYGGERGKMYHWCANMKGGKK